MWTMLGQWLLASCLMFILLGGWWWLRQGVSANGACTSPAGECNHCGITEACSLAASGEAEGQTFRGVGTHE